MKKLLFISALSFYFQLLTLTSSAQTAYITHWGSHNVSVIDCTSNTVTATIPIGSVTFGVSVSLDGSKVYVTGNNGVGVINTATNTISDTIAIPATTICVSPNGSKVYVTDWNNGDSGTVSVINTATNAITDTIAVGCGPWGVAVSPDGSKIYVANHYSNTVSVISRATNTVTDTIPVGHAPSSFGNFISIYPSHTGIAPQSMVSAGIEVYPNPATYNLTIESEQQAVVEIINIQGQLVKTYAANGKTNIDVSAFPSGVYLVEVKMEKGISVQKFIKE